MNIVSLIIVYIMSMGIMRWNDDNSNNLLCDFAGYEPKPIEEKWKDKIMYDDHPMGIPGDWDD